MPSYYGNLVDDATKRRLNNEAVQSFDTGLKGLTANARPVMSNAYGVGSLPAPAGAEFQAAICRNHSRRGVHSPIRWDS